MRRWSTYAFVLATLLILFGGWAWQSAPPTSAAAPAAIPNFSHIFEIVFENKEASQVIGNANAQYFNGLARQYGLAANFTATTHPSLPNYIALTSGDTYGISSNCTSCFIDQPNLADQVEAAGKTWKAYMESMPRPCFVGDSGGIYRQKHNPFIYYDSIRTDPARCANIVPFTQFASDLQANTLPNYVWITPNMCNSAHDCGIGTADTWLKSWVPRILASPAWQQNSVLFITFDEGSSNTGGGGKIATLVISPLGKPSFQSQLAYTHYSLLRTIEDAWGMRPLGHAASAQPMTDFFGASNPAPTNAPPPTVPPTQRPPRTPIPTSAPPPPSATPTSVPGTSAMGCKKGEVPVDAQAWWMPQQGQSGNTFGHLHTSVCFPHMARLSGVVSFRIRSTVHNNPGQFYRLMVQIFGPNHAHPGCNDDYAIVCKVFQPPRTIATCQRSGGTLSPDGMTCTWVDELKVDTRLFDRDGEQEFRFRGFVREPDGRDMRTSTGLHAVLENGHPRRDVNPAGRNYLEARGWYETVNYTIARLYAPPTGPVAGVWQPRVELKPGAGGAPVTSWYAALDTDFHNGIPGTPLCPSTALGKGMDTHCGNSEFRGTLRIDTRTLSNGWHRLFLKADARSSRLDSTNSGVLAVWFEVRN